MGAEPNEITMNLLEAMKVVPKAALKLRPASGLIALFKDKTK